MAMSSTVTAFELFLQYHLCYINPAGIEAGAWWKYVSTRQTRRLLRRWRIITAIRCDRYCYVSLRRRRRQITLRGQSPVRAQRVWQRFLRRTIRPIKGADPVETLMAIIATGRFTLRAFRAGWQTLPPDVQTKLMRYWFISTRNWTRRTNLPLPSRPKGYSIRRVALCLTAGEAGQRLCIVLR
ncbi:MAG: hypothetical protein COT71_04085 [Candidatus Andersenbacteria bacterium CG10_big_fil_rev_8_21_14_0_10_54_11]|uniref:Uncharacterized protein n=1 Tax=Candidatus Andersenbacteria bacterium CG10_big_fil_rev_8_21_14_0_10_54_11 TaxID=1974485 RepID=A0A2M6WYL8_9BACT|nr:MAG: hypothetical protein COT71_04085 [Candidatus Andersenbacteria bacterium CG10_big_fil_rev_8_21_14_0_10_54_11]